MKGEVTEMTCGVDCGVPKPAVMPLADIGRWAAELPHSAFANTSCQFQDLSGLGALRSVLVVGPGQGLTPPVLKWRGYSVTTLDIDPRLQPDYVGSIHDMAIFADQQFDALIASHVIEHLALPYLDVTLSEISRVARFALIYLPIGGKKLQVRFRTYGYFDLDFQHCVDFVNPFSRPDGVTPRYMEGQHFWEIGRPGHSRRWAIREFSRWFEVLRVYRNRDWPSSLNFVLRSKWRPPSP
jgi:predicted SAM-dependent methyltransferase